MSWSSRYYFLNWRNRLYSMLSRAEVDRDRGERGKLCKRHRLSSRNLLATRRPTRLQHHSFLCSYRTESVIYSFSDITLCITRFFRAPFSGYYLKFYIPAWQKYSYEDFNKYCTTAYLCNVVPSLLFIADIQNDLLQTLRFTLWKCIVYSALVLKVTWT